MNRRKTRKPECGWVSSSAPDYLKGRLDRFEKQRLERHLAKCAVCRSNIRILKLTEEITLMAEKLAINPDQENLDMHLEQIKIPVRTAPDVISALKKIDPRASGQSAGIRTAIQIIQSFLNGIHTFLRGSAMFSSGAEWMEFESRKALLLKEVFQDSSAAAFIPPLRTYAEILINQGLIFQLNDQFETAGRLLGNALAISRSIGSVIHRIKSHRLLGELEFYRGNIDTADAVFRSALSDPQLNEAAEEQEKLLRNCGNIAFLKRDYRNSIRLLNQALTLSRQHSDKFTHINDLNNLSAVYYKLNNVPRAIEYAHQALTFSETRKNTLTRARIQANLGTYYSIMNDIEKAGKHWREAARFFHMQEMNEDVAQIHRNIAIGYYLRRNFSRALEEINLALQAGPRDVFPYILLRGRILRKSGKVSAARSDHVSALNRAKSNRDNLMEKIAVRELAFDERALGHIQSAWELLVSGHVLNKSIREPDSVFRLEDFIEISELAETLDHAQEMNKYREKALRVHRRLVKRKVIAPGEYLPDSAYSG